MTCKYTSPTNSPTDDVEFLIDEEDEDTAASFSLEGIEASDIKSNLIAIEASWEVVVASRRLDADEL